MSILLDALNHAERAQSAASRNAVQTLRAAVPGKAPTAPNALPWGRYLGWGALAVGLTLAGITGWHALRNPQPAPQPEVRAAPFAEPDAPAAPPPTASASSSQQQVPAQPIAQPARQPAALPEEPPKPSTQPHTNPVADYAPVDSSVAPARQVPVAEALPSQQREPALARAGAQSAQLPLSTLQITPTQPPSYLRAWQAWQAGELNLARKELETLLAEHPNYRPAQLLLILVRNALGETQQAHAMLETLRAAATDPYEPLLVETHARLLLANGKSAEAKALLSEALARYPTATPLWPLLGVVALAEQEGPTAEQAYTHLVREEPHVVRWWLGLAAALTLQGKTEAAAAIHARLAQPDASSPHRFQGEQP